MAKLKFFVGPVASGKTMDLITTAYQLITIQGQESVRILKPAIDTRFSSNVVRSASGLEIKITDLIDPIQNLLSLDYSNTKYIIVDEIQFFTISQIEQFREIACTHNIDVYCYGLLSDFKMNLFESSKRMLEICDEIHQIKGYCMLCKELKNSTISYATHNLRIKKEGDKIQPVICGSTVFIGGIDTFVPVCYSCYERITRDLRGAQKNVLNKVQI